MGAGKLLRCREGLKVKGPDLRKHLDELATFKAADDSRKLTLPQRRKPTSWRCRKASRRPTASTFKLDERPDARKTAQSMAHAKGWSQSDFSDALGIVAATPSRRAGRDQHRAHRRIAKLGPPDPRASTP
jgi:hypothetical protein